MQEHCTKEEFQTVVDDETKEFALSDDEGRGAMFWGTMYHFRDCFFSNPCYENVCDFADEHGCFVEVI